MIAPGEDSFRDSCCKGGITRSTRALNPEPLMWGGQTGKAWSYTHWGQGLCENGRWKHRTSGFLGGLFYFFFFGCSFLLLSGLGCLGCFFGLGCLGFFGFRVQGGSKLPLAGTLA